MLHVFIASHLTPYRAETLPEAVKSIEYSATCANVKCNIYISCSHEPCVDVLGLIARMNVGLRFATLTVYTSEKKTQFEHIAHILENAHLPDDANVMMHDDDDVSMPRRIQVFQKTHIKNSVFCSRCAMIDRFDVATKGKDALQRVSIRSPDFATYFCTVSILRAFVTKFQDMLCSRTCDCLFQQWITKHDPFCSKEVLYVVRMRAWSCDDEYLAIESKTNLLDILPHVWTTK